ncbi:MAG: 3-hydroxyacyl-CoA dehydrogenase/enoyl-CoA hydratase family protein [Bacteroidia bacterium]|jgi:3-hydroxyacyl-CoA dehydrogenase|nr:3-hydroxyacyl-CoA dehydrogenase/enoyl-CoA hydratase family protein [Bacteroidia bacterium]
MMNLKRNIKKVAILGSGVMGSRIACHFANIGVQVVLLDRATSVEGIDVNNPQLINKTRNAIVNKSLESAITSKPAPLYLNSFSSHISTGNFDDDLNLVAGCDWIIEVVTEDLSIKRELLLKVASFRKEGSLVTTNTSGISIQKIAEGFSDEFKAHFCGTHFFNPPRYLPLLEIIPSPYTSEQVIDFLLSYGERYLGKRTVLCKDTPGFVANRIGVYSIMETFHAAMQFGFSVEEVDKLTGPIIGRPKSATFRTADVVGVDTLIKVANNLYADAVNDESKERFQLPTFLHEMSANGWYGDKTKQGFYKKEKGNSGETVIQSLDLNKLIYVPQQKVKFKALEQVRPIENLSERLPILLSGTDKVNEFYRHIFYTSFVYITHRIPEIADHVYQIDDAICTGFGWEKGPFEMWDMLGVEKTWQQFNSLNLTCAKWVEDMLASGHNSFYKIENGKRFYYDINRKQYVALPSGERFIVLDYLRKSNVVWKNSGATLFDVGDGVLNLEFHSKMNTIGGEVLSAINYSINKAEQEYNGLVIGNQGTHFSAGANLALLLMFAIEQEYDEIDMMVRQFQQTMMRVRYSSIPVVTAPFGLSLGGGCEINLHADAIQAAAETYIGLVEVGVGLIPAGGGTKELTLRTADAFVQGDIELNRLRESYMNIAMGKVATSAAEAFEMGLFKSSDEITINKDLLLTDAKRKVLSLVAAGYTQPVKRKDIKVLGRSALSMFYMGANAMLAGNYISEHDLKIANKLAWIMCGGDLTAPQLVSEDYLLDLEREAFLSLCGERKTLERIKHMLNTGKPLRN